MIDVIGLKIEYAQTVLIGAGYTPAGTSFVLAEEGQEIGIVVRQHDAVLAQDLAFEEQMTAQKLAEGNQRVADAIALNQMQSEAYKQFWDDVNTASQAGGEKQKKAFQKLAIAQAVISGYDSAVKAWNAGLSIGGIPGMIAAPIFAAASLAKIGALIAKMKSGGDSQSTSIGGGAITNRHWQAVLLEC